MTTRAQLRQYIEDHIDEWQANMRRHSIENMRRDGVCEDHMREFLQMSDERNALLRLYDIDDIVEQIMGQLH